MATFGLKYYAELSSRYMKTLWRVEIAQRDYSGESEEMTFSGSEPDVFGHQGRADHCGLLRLHECDCTSGTLGQQMFSEETLRELPVGLQSAITLHQRV